MGYMGLPSLGFTPAKLKTMGYMGLPSLGFTPANLHQPNFKQWVYNGLHGFTLSLVYTSQLTPAKLKTMGYMGLPSLGFTPANLKQCFLLEVCE